MKNAREIEIKRRKKKQLTENIMIIVSIILLTLGICLAITTKSTIKIQKVEYKQQTTENTVIIPTTTKSVSKPIKKANKIKDNKQLYINYAKELCNKYGFSEEDYNNLVKLWNRESGWRLQATNGSCYGIPQACPGSKMGKGYKTSYKVQISWGIKYIKQRYGTPTNAWKHSQNKGWY